jgi:aspartate carbamoyltransferase regulatory subunit
MQFIDMYVYDFIEKYPEFTLKRLKISRNHWRKNKIKHKIVVDYITSDDTYKKIGIKYNLSVERIRQIVALGIRVMARTQKFKDININQ